MANNSRRDRRNSFQRTWDNVPKLGYLGETEAWQNVKNT